MREDLGDNLTEPASSDSEQVPFVIGSGESATTIAPRLEEEGFLKDRRAFVLLAVERDLTGQLKTGEFILRQLDDARRARDRAPRPAAVARRLTSTCRTGLRLEQMTAKLADARRADDRPARVLRARQATRPRSSSPTTRGCELPDGASLEGYLWPATTGVLPGHDRPRSWSG